MVPNVALIKVSITPPIFNVKLFSYRLIADEDKGSKD